MKAVMYHYVRGAQKDLPYFRFLDIENFRSQLDYFESTFGFVSRDEFSASLSGTSIPPHKILLTFDDGVKDHIRFVLPELKKRHLWGLFYVATGPYLKKQLLGVHRIHYLLGRFTTNEIFAELQDLIKPEMFLDEHRDDFKNLTYARQANAELVLKFKRMFNYYISYKYRDDVLGQLMRRFVSCEESVWADFYLSEPDLKSLSQEGMVVGSHTVNHLLMAKLSRDEQASEVDSSFDYLESVCGRLPLKTFCYPYGGFHSFTAETERLLKDRGVKFSFNVEARDIQETDLLERPQALPRYDCNAFPYGKAS